MAARIQAIVERHTRKKRLTGLKYTDDLGQERITYFSTSWLAAGGVSVALGDTVTITVSGDEDVHSLSPEEREESLTGDDLVAAFIEQHVMAAPGQRLTSGHLWERWAVLHDADPSESDIAGVAKGSMAGRIRRALSLPPARRGRVEGRVQYFWPDLSVRDAAP